MAPTVPFGLPIRARAGDSWQFDLAYGDYPAADNWAPAVHIRGAEVLAFDVAWKAAQGTGWRITVPAASTALLVAGTYQIAVILTGSGAYAGQVVTVEVVSCVVQANLEAAVPGAATSWEETLIANLQKAITALTTGGVKSYMIGQRQVVYNDLPELLATLGKMNARLAMKRNPGNLGQAVKVRFREASA